MTTVELPGVAEAQSVRPPETTAAHDLPDRREGAGAPAARFIGVLWLVPTLGLLVTSLLPPTTFSNQGWWTIFSKPSLATWQNYRDIFQNGPITHSLWVTAQIAIGGTLLPIMIAALAAYAFAWLEFPGRDWLFIVVIALLVVPLQMALIPIFSLYNKLGIFDTVLSLVLFHTAFGLPFAIFLLRNFFVGIPQRHPRVGPHRRRVRDPHLPAADPAARAAGDRVARDLPVPLDVERPARRAHVRAADAADHRRDLLPARRVRLEHRDHRAGRVRLAGDPARRLLRVPALLRPGAARRLGEVTRCCRRRRARGAHRLRDAPPRRPRARRDRRLRRRTPTRRRCGAGARRRSASGGCDPRATATSARRRSPGSRCARRGGGGRSRRSPAAVCDRYHPTVGEFLEHVEEMRERSGWDESFVRAADRARARGGRAGSTSAAAARSRTS